MRPSTFLIGGVLAFMVIVLVFLLIQRPRLQERWAVYYHGNLPYAEFANYDVVVFDSDAYPQFVDNKHSGQVVLGYVSTSEAEEYRDYFDTVKAMDVLIAPNEQWAADHAIDIRKPQWREFLVETLVPRILAKGFDGVILDTIDTALHLESVDPQRFEGMSEAAVTLIKAIHKAHPDAKIMLNRGFSILPQVANDIDYALAESIRIRYQPEKGLSSFFEEPVYDELSATLKAAKRQNRRLKIMTLDYVPMTKAGVPMVRQVYAEHRRNGFIPYVTSYDLGHHHKEPK